MFQLFRPRLWRSARPTPATDIPAESWHDRVLTLINPRAGERLLVIGFQDATLVRGIWERTRGGVGEVVTLDAEIDCYQQLRAVAVRLVPEPRAPLPFYCFDFRRGLPLFADRRFDHVVIRASTTYGRLLFTESCRVLKPGGTLILVVGEPDGGRVTWVQRFLSRGGRRLDTRTDEHSEGGAAGTITQQLLGSGFTGVEEVTVGRAELFRAWN